jgi:hypothetical protein
MAEPDVILTPDQRVRVFISSALEELAAERAAARRGSVVRVAILGKDADRSLCLPRLALNCGGAMGRPVPCR